MTFEEWAKLYLPELNNIQLKMLINKVDELIQSKIDENLLHRTNHADPRTRENIENRLSELSQLKKELE